LEPQAPSNDGPVGHGRCYEEVLRLLEALPRGRVLDAPAGDGGLGARIAEKGFEVVLVDIDPKANRTQLPCLAADLNCPLPFPDASFDVVVCSEGIEHIAHPHGLMAEIARVLKPEGHLVLTFPNICSMKGRMNFLLESRLASFGDFTEDASQGFLKAPGHVNPIPYVEVRHLLNKNGFEIVSLGTDRMRYRWHPVSVLLGWLIRRRTRIKNPYHADLLSPALLYGDHVVLVARRTQRATR